MFPSASFLVLVYIVPRVSELHESLERHTATIIRQGYENLAMNTRNASHFAMGSPWKLGCDGSSPTPP